MSVTAADQSVPSLHITPSCLYFSLLILFFFVPYSYFRSPHLISSSVLSYFYFPKLILFSFSVLHFPSLSSSLSSFPLCHFLFMSLQSSSILFFSSFAAFSHFRSLLSLKFFFLLYSHHFYRVFEPFLKMKKRNHILFIFSL